MGDGNCIRLSLIGVNVLFLLGGLALLGLGIWVQVAKGDYVALADSDTGLTGAILIMAGGGATALISLIGFLGAWKRSSVLLWIFFFVLVVIVVVQLVAVALGMIYRDEVEDELHDDMKKSVEDYKNDVEGVTKAWDWAQKKFDCCGVDNYTDWRISPTFNPGGRHTLVPDSCCKDNFDGCGNFTGQPGVHDVKKDKVYTNGCFTELKEFVRDHLLVIGLSALFFLVLELVVIVLTIILALKIGNSSKFG